MQLKQYEKYKNSEVDNLGFIPTHWEVTHVKRSCKLITDGAHTSPDLSSSDYPFLSVVNLKSGSLDFVNCLFTSENDYRQLVRNGCKPRKYDVLFSKDGTIAETVVIEEEKDFVVASSFIILSPILRKINPKYFHYYLSCEWNKFQSMLYVRGAGLPRISIFNQSKLFMLLPLLEEQEEIAKYLNEKTKQFDAKREALKRKITKYEELRKSLINETISRGLNKNVELQDSGIEWLGKMPKHWKIERLKDAISKLESGSRDKGGAKDEGIPSLSAEHIDWNGHFYLQNMKYVSEQFYTKMNGGKIRLNDILITKDGATIGKTAIIEKMYFDEMAVNEHMYILRADKKILPKLLFYIIISVGVGQIRRTIKHTAVPGINSFFISETFISFSEDFDEQNELVAYLDKRTESIDKIVNNLQTQIDKLKELKQTLINDVVTGKLKIG